MFTFEAGHLPGLGKIIANVLTDGTRTWRKHWCGIYKQRNCNKYLKEGFVIFLYIWAL